MLLANTQRSIDMTAHRLLQLNALSTAACALVMVATRGLLHTQFGLSSPWLLDMLAGGLFVYAAAMALAAWKRPVARPALLAFTVADAAWVLGSAVILFAFWNDFAPLARVAVVLVAVVVEIFATLQFRAARRVVATA
jgi:hypothetical protein